MRDASVDIVPGVSAPESVILVCLAASIALNEVRHPFGTMTDLVSAR